MAARTLNAPGGVNPLAGAMGWWRLLVAYLLSAVRWMKTHQGAEVLLKTDATLKVQAKLARALGGSDPAIVVQKLHEWIQFNRSQNSEFHFRKGQWWTFNSYKEWKENHFDWLSVYQISNLFRDLEKAGIVISARLSHRKGDQRKWYRLDYKALYAAVAKGSQYAASSGHRANLNHGSAKSHGHDSKTQSRSCENRTMNQYSNSKKKNAIPQFQPAPSKLSSWQPPIPAAAPQALKETTKDEPFDEHWHNAWMQLGLLLDRGSFDAWLEKAKFVAVEGSSYTIEVHSSYAQEACQHRLYRNIQRVLRDVRGEPVEIRFVIAGQGVQNAA